MGATHNCNHTILTIEATNISVFQHNFNFWEFHLACKNLQRKSKQLHTLTHYTHLLGTKYAQFYYCYIAEHCFGCCCCMGVINNYILINIHITLNCFLIFFFFLYLKCNFHSPNVWINVSNEFQIKPYKIKTVNQYARY